MPIIPSETFDTYIVSGISVGFALVFFLPLLAVVFGFFFYCAFARASVLRAAKVLSILWVVASVPAAFFIMMGHAFNSAKAHPLLVVPVWVATGLVLLWIPVMLRVVFRIKPL